MVNMSKRLIGAYVLDWIVMVIIAGIGAGINYVEPYKRPFSLMDLSISYPVQDEQITIGLLAVIALVIPAVIIFLIVIALVPGPRTTRGLSRKTMITRKLWEWEKGWAGLALSLVISFFITQGMKNIFGKPRPSCIARCQPNLDNIQQHVVSGGYGATLDPRWQLVSANICGNPDAHLVNDAFKSFPSGHASFSWAGLLYLSFFLCSKFAIQIPHLPMQSPTARSDASDRQSMAQELLPLHHNGEPIASSPKSDTTAAGYSRSRPVPARNQAASPPTHLIIVAGLPVAVTVYICSTRFVEFWHFGFDLISGSLIGIGSAWFAFRWYHLPIGRGSGWAWGPRSKDRAFGIGVGIGNYADAEGWSTHRGGASAGSGGVARPQRLDNSNVNGGYSHGNGIDAQRGNESFQSYRGNEGGPAYGEERV